MHFRESPTKWIVRWGESVRLAFGAIAAEKLKASLTTLSVVIGSAALVLVVTIASTGKVYIVSLIEGIGANLTYATLNRSDVSSVLEDELSPGDLAALRQTLPRLSAIAGTYDLPADFQFEGSSFHARLVGVTQDFQKIRNLRITSGRYFDPEDFMAHYRVCLVTDRLAQSAVGLGPAVGKFIRLDQFRCTIIGTFQEGVPTFGASEIQDATLLVPFPLVKDITGDDFFQVLYAQVASSEEVSTMTQQIANVLRSRHRKEARYSVDNLSALLETAAKVSVALTVVLIAVAILTLMVAGTGIMNIMLVNVTQRTHEIGIRKALGASPAEVRLQFLLEAFFISFAGALVGVLMALGIVWSVTWWARNALAISISWTSVLVALVVSSGVGVLFGYRPASEAANLNPIDALRIE
jgi:putative ABC transport system permease protein